MIINIIIGLLGLGIVVILHEYGHFIAAKMVGVGVKVFSLGWGKKICAFQRHETEYRISFLPLGGYVRLKGEEALTDAYKDNREEISTIPQGFFSVAPWKRIVIAAFGPLFNIIGAWIIFALILSIGYNITTYENRIVLVSEVNDERHAADDAGLESGDRIVGIDGTPVSYFSQIREMIVDVGDNDVSLVVERDGRQLALTARPQIDRNSGASVLGIYPWIDPVVGSVTPSSIADNAGIEAGDIIIALNEMAIPHSARFTQLREGLDRATLTIRRDGTARKIDLTGLRDTDGMDTEIGILFATSTVRSNEIASRGAALQALWEIGRVFRLTIRGIGAIFSGAQLANVIAGPIQLTSLIGEVTTSDSGAGVWSAMRLFFHFLAVISVALCFMNLLPVPILDGGQMLLYSYEALRRKMLKPKTIIAYQKIGAVFITALLILALTSDFIFLFFR